MEYPVINEIVFDPTMDYEINKDLIGDYCAETTSHDQEEDAFKSIPCRFRIEDQHDSEDKPHYILDIGDKFLPKHCCRKYVVRYVDYLSTSAKKEEGEDTNQAEEEKKPKGDIENAPGRWTIYVWLGGNSYTRSGKGNKELAMSLNCVYERAMDKSLPQYFILTSPLMEVPLDEEEQ